MTVIVIIIEDSQSNSNIFHVMDNMSVLEKATLYFHALYISFLPFEKSWHIIGLID